MIVRCPGTLEIICSSVLTRRVAATLWSRPRREVGKIAAKQTQRPPIAEDPSRPDGGEHLFLTYRNEAGNRRGSSFWPEWVSHEGTSALQSVYPAGGLLADLTFPCQQLAATLQERQEGEEERKYQNITMPLTLE